MSRDGTYRKIMKTLAAEPLAVTRLGSRLIPVARSSRAAGHASSAQQSIVNRRIANVTPLLPLNPIDLTTDLVRIPSVSGAEGEVMGAVEMLLRQREWSVRRIGVSPGRDNLLATSTDAPLVTLSTHLDTVPPHIAPRR